VNAEGGPIEPMKKSEIEFNAADFLTKMANSPLFASRYKAMRNREVSPEETEVFRQHIINNINSVDYWPVGYEYTGKPWEEGDHLAYYNRIFDLPKDKYGIDVVGNSLNVDRHLPMEHIHTIFRKDASPTSTVHELSHASTISDSIPARIKIPYSADPAKVDAVNKFSRTDFNRSTEHKAYLDEVRKYLYDNKIYDPINKAFEESDYNNLIKAHDDLKAKIKQDPNNTELKYIEGAFQKTIDPYDKPQTIQLFNSFVKNDVPSNNTQNIQYAAHGGYLAPILPMHFDKGTQIYRDTTEIPNYRQGGKLMDFPAPSLSEREANINYNVYASMPGRYYNNGGMIKRADGSYSQRGLWDNIRANKGSGKEPTKEMLAQERKIKANEHAFGGNMIRTSHLLGMGGHKAVFFPTNVSEPGAADKDLTYPKDAYVYANGGHLYDGGGDLITYKTHSKLINGTGNFKAISKVDISSEYNEQIKHRLYTGKWGFDPETGTLHLLKPKDRAVVSQNIRNIRAEEENVKAYNKSMEEAGGIDPRLMRPQTKMSQEEINNYIKEGHKAAIDFLPFKLAAYATPWGAAAGTVEGAGNLIPDLYKGNYGAAAMDALMVAPAIGPGVRRIAYNAIEPAGYGVMQKIKDAPKTFVKNIMDPAGRPLRTGQLLTESTNAPEEQMIEMGKNRLDAWRVGLKMPQKYDTFEQIGDNVYRIKNMKPEKGRLSAIDKDIKAYELSKKTGIKKVYNSSEIEYLENPEKHKEYNDELKKLFDEHDIIAGPPSKNLTDINNIKRYLRKTGDLKTPPWQQTRIVEKSLQPEFTHSVYDLDSQGIMGSYRWDVRPHESGLLHYQSNDTWNLNPWESRGHTKVNPSQEEINILKRFYNEPLQNIEALSLIGGRPFQIQNNFSVNPKTFDVMGKWANGGHMSTTKTVFRTSELF
jgi:hypothetical protein